MIALTLRVPPPATRSPPRRAAIAVSPVPIALRPEPLGELAAEPGEALGPVQRPVPSILPRRRVLPVPTVVRPAAAEPLPAVDPVVALVLPRRASRRRGRRLHAVVEPPPVVVEAVAVRPLPLHAAAALRLAEKTGNGTAAARCSACSGDNETEVRAARGGRTVAWVRWLPRPLPSAAIDRWQAASACFQVTPSPLLVARPLPATPSQVAVNGRRLELDPGRRFRLNRGKNDSIHRRRRMAATRGDSVTVPSDRRATDFLARGPAVIEQGVAHQYGEK